MRDVREFAGHIACDGDTRSEIVVPVVVGEKVSFFSFLFECLAALSRLIDGCGLKKLVAIIDIDSKVEGGFDEVDIDCLELFSQLLARSCDWGT